MLCLTPWAVCLSHMNGGGFGSNSIMITLFLLGITENIQNTEDSRETFPLRIQKRERIKYTSYQLHELETAFKMNQYPSVSGREHLARIIGVTESRIQVNNSTLSQHSNILTRCMKIVLRSSNELTDGICLLGFRCGLQTKGQNTKLEGTRLMKQDQDQKN